MEDPRRSVHGDAYILRRLGVLPGALGAPSQSTSDPPEPSCSGCSDAKHLGSPRALTRDPSHVCAKIPIYDIELQARGRLYQHELYLGPAAQTRMG